MHVKAGELNFVPSNLGDVKAVVYESWTASVHPIDSIDLSQNTIYLGTPYNPEWGGGASGNRFYLENLIEAMDQPGEFYFDRSTSILNWLVAEGVNPNDMQVVVPQLIEVRKQLL